MVHLTENDVVQIKGAARLQGLFPQHDVEKNNWKETITPLSTGEKANRYQQVICTELSNRLGQDVNEFVASLPGLIDEALAARDFEKVKQLTVLKSQIFDLMF